MTRDDLGPTFSLDLLYGVVTFAGVGLAFLALDDITTDAASAFLVERAALAGCALWFTVAAWRLLRQGHQVLGGLSLGVVAALVLAQPAMGPGTTPSVRWEYVASVGSLVWFVVMGGALVRSAWRPGSRYTA